MKSWCSPQSQQLDGHGFNKAVKTQRDDDDDDETAAPVFVGFKHLWGYFIVLVKVSQR